MGAEGSILSFEDFNCVLKSGYAPAARLEVTRWGSVWSTSGGWIDRFTHGLKCCLNRK